MSYAINTDQAVFSIDRQYYCVYGGGLVRFEYGLRPVRRRNVHLP